MQFTDTDLALLDCVVTSQLHELKAYVGELNRVENPAKYQMEQLEFYKKMVEKCERLLKKIRQTSKAALNSRKGQLNEH